MGHFHKFCQTKNKHKKLSLCCTPPKRIFPSELVPVTRINQVKKLLAATDEALSECLLGSIDLNEMNPATEGY